MSSMATAEPMCSWVTGVRPRQSTRCKRESLHAQGYTTRCYFKGDSPVVASAAASMFPGTSHCGLARASPATRLRATIGPCMVITPLKYLAVFTGGIAFSTWVNARVRNRRKRALDKAVGAAAPSPGGPAALPTTAEAVSPNLFFKTLWAFADSATVKAGLELRVFTHIAAAGRAGQAATVERVARASGAAERGIRVLLDSLASLGFLHKDVSAAPQYSYTLTPSSAQFLDEKSETYMGDSRRWVYSDMLVKGYQSFTEVVRSGQPVTRTPKPSDECWVVFAEALSELARAEARKTARAALQGLRGRSSLKVLDVAASHGHYGIELARQHKGVSVTALDWPNVLKIAWKNAEAAGLTAPPPLGQGERFTLLAGDAHKVSLGSDYDLIMVPNFLHMFDEATCTEFLTKCQRALAPDGAVCMLEIIPDEHRTTPAVHFARNMLVGTAAGDAYTYQDLRRFATSAGFKQTALVPLPDSRSSVVMAYRQPQPSPSGAPGGPGEQATGVQAAGPLMQPPLPQSPSWEYPMSLGSFMEVLENIIKEYLPTVPADWDS